MIVFLGGAGAGLSALVNIFHDLGFNNILVIDKYKSEISERLEKKGINVLIGEDKYSFNKEDIIIYSDAVIDSKDFKKAKDNIKFSYFQFVGEISKWFQTISIAGTHGKSSTSALAIKTAKGINFSNLGLAIVGAFIPELDNKNYYINKAHLCNIKEIFEKLLTKKGGRPHKLFKEYFFIIEADEFNKHFLLLDNYISLITKVDHDHKDIYKTEKEYLQAFIQFINKTRKTIYTLDKNFYNLTKNKINYPEELKLISKNIFNFKYVFGNHMQENASLVLELYKSLGFNEKLVKNEIENFKGLWRRQEYLGKINNLDIYSDYAHHPVEIEATYNGFKEKFHNKKLVGVFQPHQLFRFISYENDFINSLKKFDKIYIYDIYSVREDNILNELAGNNINKEEQKKIIGENIARKISGEYIDSFEKLIKKIQNESGIGIFMSAGDLDYKLRNYISNL